MLLWCDGRHEDSGIDELADNFRHRKILHFPTPVKFTRWLFQQRRGDITPWAVLVAGWREAKPCLLAIRAAHTGEVDCLRPDARRPELRSPTSSIWSSRRTCESRANIAVAKMIVVVEKPQQELRIQSWIQTEMADLLDFQIELAHSVAEVVELSTQPHGAGGVRRGAGGGLERMESDIASSPGHPSSAQGQVMQTPSSFHPSQQMQQQQQTQQHLQPMQSMQPMQQMLPMQQQFEQQPQMNFQQHQHQQQQQVFHFQQQAPQSQQHPPQQLQQQQQQQQQPQLQQQQQQLQQQQQQQQLQQHQQQQQIWSGAQQPPMNNGCYGCSSPVLAAPAANNNNNNNNNSSFCPVIPYCGSSVPEVGGGCCMMQPTSSTSQVAGGGCQQSGFYVMAAGHVGLGSPFPGRQDGQPLPPGGMMQTGHCAPMMGENPQGSWNRMRTLSPDYNYRGSHGTGGDGSSESSQDNSTAAPLPQFSSCCSNNNSNTTSSNNNNSAYNCAALSTFSNNSTQSTACNSCGVAAPVQQPNNNSNINNSNNTHSNYNCASVQGPSIMSLETRSTASSMSQNMPGPVANPRSPHYFGSAPLIGNNYTGA